MRLSYSITWQVITSDITGGVRRGSGSGLVLLRQVETTRKDIQQMYYSEIIEMEGSMWLSSISLEAMCS